jgi:aryl-alcohol dehydrogenase-like predicted oxidoreductase
MRERLLGHTGLKVSAMGLGCGPMGELPRPEAERLIHTAIDLGISLFDTARSYAESEEHLGSALRSVRRSSYVLVTKGGYGVDGAEDWTPRAIELGIERALGQLRCETLDVFLLHSCDRERLTRGDLFEPLQRAKADGKVRAVGYAGDGDALAYAVHCGAFDVIECSVNLFDQRALHGIIPQAGARGVGVIAKRALGNAPWLEDARPSRFDAGLYWDRMRAMYDGQHLGARAWNELAVRFATYAPGVDGALVGTRSAVHLGAAVEAAERGPLGSHETHDVRERFTRQDAGWEGVV